MYRQHSHCSYCGHAFTHTQGWPRRCAHCRSTVYRNPLPVALVLLPVDSGLLVIRRAAAPRMGQLALPGGFIEIHESWQEAAARELREETGVLVPPAAIDEFGVRSTNDGYLLIFGLAPTMREHELPHFLPNGEANDRLLLTTPAELAFPLHTEMVARFFARKLVR